MTEHLSRIARRIIDGSSHRPELTRFATWLVAERYAPFVVEQHLRRVDFVLGRLPRGRPPPGTYSTVQLDAVFGVECSPRSRLYRFAGTRRAYERFLRDCGRLRTGLTGPVDRFATVRCQYGEFLREVRGLGISSREHHAWTVADFLTRALRPRQRLCSLTLADVERFVLLRSKEVSHASLQHTVGHVRSFLRFLHDAGELPDRLDRLDTPRTYRGELPPRAVPWPMVKALLASIDRRSKAGWRDACVLHLAAYYGLRPSEIVALRLDSIDWERQVLHVHQSKTRSELELPLGHRRLTCFAVTFNTTRRGALSTIQRCFTAHDVRTVPSGVTPWATSWRSARGRLGYRCSDATPTAFDTRLR